MDWFMMMPPLPYLRLTRHDIINCSRPAFFANDDRHNSLPLFSLSLSPFCLSLTHESLFHLQQIWKLIWKTFDSWLSRISQCVIYIYIYYLIFLLLCTSSFPFRLLCFALLRFALFTLHCCRCRCLLLYPVLNCGKGMPSISREQRIMFFNAKLSLVLSYNYQFTLITR